MYIMRIYVIRERCQCIEMIRLQPLLSYQQENETSKNLPSSSLTDGSSRTRQVLAESSLESLRETSAVSASKPEDTGSMNPPSIEKGGNTFHWYKVMSLKFQKKKNILAHLTEILGDSPAKFYVHIGRDDITFERQGGEKSDSIRGIRINTKIGASKNGSSCKTKCDMK